MARPDPIRLSALSVGSPGPARLGAFLVAALALTACGGGGGGAAATVPGGGSGGGGSGGDGSGGGGGDGGPTPPTPTPAWAPSFLAADLRLDSDAAGAATSLDPDVACDGTTVAVVWTDTRNGSKETFFRCSLDAGATWLPNDMRLGTAPVGLANASRARVAVVGTAIYVVWADDRNGATDVFFNRTLNGGLTWLVPDVRLDTSPVGASASDVPQLAASGTNLWVVWQDGRNGAGRDVYLNRSADGGVTWLAGDVRLDTDVAGAANSVEPRLAVSGTAVHVVWTDQRNGLPDVYANSSADGGVTWRALDARLDTDLAGTAMSVNPAVAASGTSAWVVWEDRRAGAGDVRLNRTTDGGATWLAADVRLDTDAPGAASSTTPCVAGAGAEVRVAWLDARAGQPDVRFNRSTDGGASWLGADVRVQGGTEGAAASGDLRIAGDATRVFVVYTDPRAGATDVRASGSVDGGATFTVDVRLDLGDPAGASPSSRPALATAGARVYVVWSDARAGAEDIRFTTTP